jgi:hypothetical protein
MADSISPEAGGIKPGRNNKVSSVATIRLSIMARDSSLFGLGSVKRK